MWKPNPKRTKKEELWWRANLDKIGAPGYGDFNNPSNIMYFTKDFIREFKDKFNWKTTGSRFILILHSDKFFEEMTGEKY